MYIYNTLIDFLNVKKGPYQLFLRNHRGINQYNLKKRKYVERIHFYYGQLYKQEKS